MDDDDRYRDAFLARVGPAVRHAHRLMTRERLADHVIVVVAADGRIEASVRQREEFWHGLIATVRGRAKLPATLPVQPAGMCWVILINGEHPEGGMRLQVGGFDGDLVEAFKRRRLLS